MIYLFINAPVKGKIQLPWEQVTPKYVEKAGTHNSELKYSTWAIEYGNMDVIFHWHQVVRINHPQG